MKSVIEDQVCSLPASLLLFIFMILLRLFDISYKGNDYIKKNMKEDFSDLRLRESGIALWQL